MFTQTSSREFGPHIFACSHTQTNWITRPKIPREIIYDAVKRSSTTAGYDTVHGTQDPKNKQAKIDGPVIRQQLKCCKTNQDEMEKYSYQMELILENIFGPNDSERKKNPKHWMYKMTNIVGGLEYQHAHADQGW
jgi:hypothetical protein